MRLKQLNTFILGLFFIGLLSSCSIVDPDYVKEINIFRKKRINFLKSREGYLNLVGLHWIFNGNYIVGSSSNNDLVFPSGFPSIFAVMNITEDSIQFSFDVSILLDSTKQVSQFSYSKNQLNHTFSWKSYEWFVIKRGALYALRIKDYEIPALSESFEIPAFPAVPSWRIKGHFTAYPKQQKRTISNIYGDTVQQLTAGIVTFDHAGNTFELESNIEAGKLAIIFKDATTGKETYSGGRQLYLTEPDNNGNVFLDFNRAFNFPCAFNDFTTCPVPPERNHLPFHIKAGEKSYRKK